MTSICFNQENPKKCGSGAYDRYEIFKSATNWTEFFELGGTKGDKKNSIDKEYCVETELKSDSESDDESETESEIFHPIDDVETEAESESDDDETEAAMSQVNGEFGLNLVELSIETFDETPVEKPDDMCVSCYPKSAGVFLCENCKDVLPVAGEYSQILTEHPVPAFCSQDDVEDAIQISYDRGYSFGYEQALKDVKANKTLFQNAETELKLINASLTKKSPMYDGLELKCDLTKLTKKSKPVAQKKPSQATGKKAAKKSSFKFSKIDVLKPNYIISFISKDGLSEIEYCPKFIVENNEKTLNFINGNPTYQRQNSYSNSTKKIPGSFCFRADEDSVQFKIGTRNQFWKENKSLLKEWMK